MGRGNAIDAMSDADAIDAACRRLAAALEALESAVERRAETDRDLAAVADQVHAFETDRARLATELDQVTAHARHLEDANREVARRLADAIETIRTVIEEQER